MPLRPLCAALTLLALVPLAAACRVAPAAPPARDAVPISRVAFGSCLRQDRPQPVWKAVLARRPQLFLLLGDNVYADGTSMLAKRAAYGRLAANPGFRRLRALCPVLATWDDHDYGSDDVGADYPVRERSQQVFLDFLDEPGDSPRRRRRGVYDSATFGPPGRRLQVILLDTRYHRSRLRTERRGDRRVYVGNDDPAATMLGEEQWRWLEERLGEPAELRLVASSIQVLAEDQPYEKWANLPRERARLLELIRRTRAAGVLFLSGDRHHSELTVLDGAGYRLHDLTSSSLNNTSDPQQDRNRLRLGEAVFADNFGLVEIDWEEASPALTLAIVDTEGKTRLEHRLKLGDLATAP